MKPIILSFLILFSMSLKAQNCNCLNNFDHVVNSVKLNYAGYADKVKENNYSEFSLFTSKLRRKAAKASDVKSCCIVLRTWTEWFKDHHLRVQLDWRFREKYPDITKQVNQYFKGGKRVPLQANYPDNKSDLKLLDPDAVLLRLPSFEWSEKTVIDSLMKANIKQLESAKYWVIDIRGNVGGTDYSFNSILPYIYTNPIIGKPDEYLSSKGNIDILKEGLKSEELNAEAKSFIKKLILLMEEKPGSFVNPSGVESVETKLEKNYVYPKKVGILIDRNSASSAETFLLMAKQSSKVSVYGENSAGMLDYGNTQFFNIPCKDLNLVIPISRSMRLPEHPIDNIGISPDKKIDRNDPDPVASVLKAIRKD
ncbi:S41 family peptidase [Pedobacter sp. BG31]|uniref:S41 family peptidase n=1 Tax=Pedobacter sp. BG31 TaxID=3349697 RepID=UPI0035F4384A